MVSDIMISEDNKFVVTVIDFLAFCKHIIVTRGKVTFAICEQRQQRPVCAFAHFDQGILVLRYFLHYY